MSEKVHLTLEEAKAIRDINNELLKDKNADLDTQERNLLVKVFNELDKQIKEMEGHNYELWHKNLL